MKKKDTIERDLYVNNVETEHDVAWLLTHDQRSGAYLREVLKNRLNEDLGVLTRVFGVRLLDNAMLEKLMGVDFVDERIANSAAKLQELFGEENVYRHSVDIFICLVHGEEALSDSYLERIRIYMKTVIVQNEFSMARLAIGEAKGTPQTAEQKRALIALAIHNIDSETPQEELKDLQDRELPNVDLDGNTDVDAVYRFADLDTLTRTIGMRTFREMAGHVLGLQSETDRKETIVFFDLANFREYNRRYGFDAGDEMLARFGTCLRDTYSNRLVSHLGDDHFAVLCFQDEAEKGIQAVNREMKDGFKAGICIAEAGEMDVMVLCDRAKLAAESIKRHQQTIFRYYDISMQEEEERSLYIERHLDEAIENEWIQVYFQPVVRSMSGKVCSVEALARWNDPHYGMLSPGLFIEVLEKKRLIHKLDLYVIEKVCWGIRQSMDQGEECFPASFNLSPIDFQVCDIFEEVDKIVSKYRIQKELLHVEVTESTMMQDADYIREQILKFREAGYEVWLDDFGSGFSSLNMLKDFKFDTLKIDMMFLRNYTERSEIVLKSIVDMAKQLGMKTLTEGVETEEQKDFLTRIGCEMQQGFYYSKPIPRDQALELLQKKLGYERGEERLYMRQIGKVNLLNLSPHSFDVHPDKRHELSEESIPFSLIEYDHGKFKSIFANQTFSDLLVEVGMAESHEGDVLAQAAENVNDGSWFYSRYLRETAATIGESGVPGMLNFVSNEDNYVLKARRVAVLRDKVYTFAVTLENIAKSEGAERSNKLNQAMTSLYASFEYVSYLDLDEMISETLYQNTGIALQYEDVPLKESLEHFRDNMIYLGDRDRYWEMFDPDTIWDRIAPSSHGILSGYFRVRNDLGEYRWKLMTLIQAPNFGSRNVLVTMRPVEDTHREMLSWIFDHPDASRGLDKNMIYAAACWEAVREDENAAIFCKDRDLRFTGANPKFKKLFGLKSDEDYIGKTEEEAGIHLEPTASHDNEKTVMENGRAISNIAIESLIDGKLNKSLATIFPVYVNGSIVGLIGSILDEEALELRRDKFEEFDLVDPLSGTMNHKGFNYSVADCIDHYEHRGIDFLILGVEIDNFEVFNANYGDQAGAKMLRTFGDALKERLDQDCSVCRIGGAKFFILTPFVKGHEATDLMTKVNEAGRSIHAIDGKPCTIYLNTGYVSYSEAGDLMNMQSKVDYQIRVNRELRKGW